MACYAVSFDDEIRIWWDKRSEMQPNRRYRLIIDGKQVVYTSRIYYNVKNLEGGKKYKFQLQVVDENLNVLGVTEEYEYETLPAKKPIDVTKAPYNAVGDGITDNTEALQKALNDCDVHSYVHVPLGVYVTKPLTMNGDVKLSLDAGAVLVTKNNAEFYFKTSTKLPMMCEVN